MRKDLHTVKLKEYGSLDLHLQMSYMDFIRLRCVPFIPILSKTFFSTKDVDDHMILIFKITYTIYYI